MLQTKPPNMNLCALSVITPSPGHPIRNRSSPKEHSR